MKEKLINSLNKYLEIYPDEYERQTRLINYLNTHDDNQIVDWNNFDGHVVAGGFVFAKEEKKFLVLYHNDLKMYLYPGGHVDGNDTDPLSASIREVKEETGLTNLNQLQLVDDIMVPIDIDTHMIGYNTRLNLPEHYHFDFRYLFMIDKIEDIKLDNEELSNFQWIDLNELRNDINYGKIASKIEALISNNKVK